ncbi:MAG: 4Fe-4S dicluster domain-containing protein [Acidimicrobiia bacterium]
MSGETTSVAARTPTITPPSGKADGSTTADVPLQRRTLIKKLAAATAGATVSFPWLAELWAAEPESLTALAESSATVTAQPLPDVENNLIRMQNELRRALEKPIEQRRWIMVIDLRKCVGCHACTVSCKAENALPPGVVYRPVLEEEIGTYPNVSRRFIPRPCMQCENPPCVPVCPVGATYKRPDGIVEIDYDQCIGCRYCITACPYSARTFDVGVTYTHDTPEEMAYELRPTFEYGTPRPREGGKSPVGNVRKCHFCLHRISDGMLPACVSTCIGGATFFGDANDVRSLVAELIGSPRVMRLKEEMGTNPKVYYLV